MLRYDNAANVSYSNVKDFFKRIVPNGSKTISAEKQPCTRKKTARVQLDFLRVRFFSAT